MKHKAHSPLSPDQEDLADISNRRDQGLRILLLVVGIQYYMAPQLKASNGWRQRSVPALGLDPPNQTRRSSIARLNVYLAGR